MITNGLYLNIREAYCLSWLFNDEDHHETNLGSIFLKGEIEMSTILFQQNFQLTHHAHQSHIVYRVHVPKGTQNLYIHFNYDPLLETNKTSMRRSLDKEGLYQDQEDDYEGFRNLLTLSVNDPEVFRGAHHYFDVDQEIVIGQEQASLGFVSGKLPSGMWEIVLSSHGIFSDVVHGSIRVSASGDLPHAQQTCPFYLTQSQGIEDKDRSRDVSQPLKDYKIELHSHTNHSDASQSTLELLEAASDQGLDWLAITDHNTISAIYEAQSLLSQCENLTVQLLAGIEYTTFYGHFLVHGPLENVQKNWTGVSLDNVDQYFAQLKSQGVNITVAHPYDTGNPYCTGCRFDFPIVNYRYIDSIEVWNETNPLDRPKNIHAYAHWVELLSEGMEINASMGRDWHRPTPGDRIPATHVLVEEKPSEASMLRALNLGRTYISLGGTLSLWINDIYTIGDRIPHNQECWQAHLSLADLPKDASKISLFTEEGLVDRFDLADRADLDHFQLSLDITLDMSASRLLRVEVQNDQGLPLLFTNPIYRATQKD